MTEYEITLSRVVHDRVTVEAASEEDAVTKAKELATKDYDAELSKVVDLVEQGEEDKYFATDEVLGILRRRAGARTLDVTLESIELKGDRQVVVKDNGFVRPREAADLPTATDKTLQKYGFDFCRVIEGIWNRPDICAQVDVELLTEHLDMDAGELSVLISEAIHVADDCCINPPKEN